MSTKIKVKDKFFSPFITAAEIDAAIEKMAAQMNINYKDKRPLFLSVLNGSFLFTADLLRKITVDCEVSFIKLSSYSGTQSTGVVNSLIGLNEDVTGREIIILEDIVDTGHTIVKLVDLLKEKNPSSIKVATLLYKPEAYKMDVPIDYVGLSVGNDFLIGYGLDYDGAARNLKEIYKIE